MKNYLLVIVVGVLSACTSTVVKDNSESNEDSQEISLDQYCETNDCRNNRKVELLVESGLIEELLELYWPVVMENRVSLLPGDKVYIEAEIVGGMVTNLNQVEEPIHEDRTITFDFGQMEGEIGMMLSVQNPFNKPMKYHLDMIDFQGNSHQTSSCAVMASGGAFEHWPHAIPELIVSNIRAIDKSDSIECVY